MSVKSVPVDIKLITEAIKKNNGYVSRAAKSINCSPSTIFKYSNIHPEVKQAIEEARRNYGTELVDCAEDSLLKRVNDGDVTSILFALKTRGKERGYDQDVDKVSPNITVNIPNSDEKKPDEEPKE
jgi:hypothetical protein